MSDRPPDFDELVGPDLGPEERERLRRVHELLVEAGPPPDLPPELVAAPPPPVVTLLPRRRRLPLALAAAALAIAVFGAGFLVGDRADEPAVEFVVPMQGDGARASLAVLEQDDAGNWPMELVVRGLPEGTYELWLTKGGELAASCGTFAVAGEKTEVPLNTPERLRRYDGWVITRAGGGEPLLSTA